MLYQYDEDCAGDGVIALRRFTRVKGFGGFPELFLCFGWESKGMEVVDRLSCWDKLKILPGYGHKIF